MPKGQKRERRGSFLGRRTSKGVERNERWLKKRSTSRWSGRIEEEKFGRAIFQTDLISRNPYEPRGIERLKRADASSRHPR